jgi:outer membrane protein OmpA-like peptidoglycan-associated protein
MARTMIRFRSLASLPLAAALLAGCAADDPHLRAETGALMGAAGGAVLGHQISHRHGALVGAAAGALAGAAIGDYMDRQQREVERDLAAERGSRQLWVERLPGDTLRLTLDGEVTFDVDKADIRRAFRPSLNRIARILRRYDRTVVHVIGHTDSTGSDAYNQDLSERRAEAVADYLESRGVPPGRVLPQGRGKREPRAENDTPQGRQLNRRVEIYIKPVIAGREAEAYEPPGPFYPVPGGAPRPSFHSDRGRLYPPASPAGDRGAPYPGDGRPYPDADYPRRYP